MVNQFAPYLAGDKGTFIVKNVASSKKTIKIFQYPIPYGYTRDLLQIPGVGEADIRASLLKGELRNKIQAQEIIITSTDVELIQFNESQKLFLQTAGVLSGVEVGVEQSSGLAASGSTGGGDLGFVLKQNITPIGTKNGTNRTFITPDRFIDGSFNGHSLRIEVFHNGRLLVKNTDYTISESVVGLGFNIITFTAIAPVPDSQLIVHYAVAT